jgi:hypothetical protein
MKSFTLLISIIFVITSLDQGCLAIKSEAPRHMKLTKPVRDFLLQGDTPIVNEFGAYGYILITSKPDSNYRDLYKRDILLTQAYIDNFPIADANNKDTTSVEMITYWMIRRYPFYPASSPEKKQAVRSGYYLNIKSRLTAQAILSAYDFDRAIPCCLPSTG